MNYDYSQLPYLEKIFSIIMLEELHFIRTEGDCATHENIYLELRLQPTSLFRKNIQYHYTRVVTPY